LADPSDLKFSPKLRAIEEIAPHGVGMEEGAWMAAPSEKNFITGVKDGDMVEQI
jgi:hypothetical protein